MYLLSFVRIKHTTLQQQLSVVHTNRIQSVTMTMVQNAIYCTQLIMGKTYKVLQQTVNIEPPSKGPQEYNPQPRQPGTSNKERKKKVEERRKVKEKMQQKQTTYKRDTHPPDPKVYITFQMKYTDLAHSSQVFSNFLTVSWRTLARYSCSKIHVIYLFACARETDNFFNDLAIVIQAPSKIKKIKHQHTVGYTLNWNIKKSNLRCLWN